MASSETSTTKRQKGGGESGIDRISNLPESIISYILSFLPTKSAIATSFLSKSWKLRGPKLTVLHFDDSFWISSGGGGGGDDDDDDGTVLPNMNFVEFVNMVLIKHIDESIHEFSLKWKHHELRSAYLNIWLDTVIPRNVQVIDIDLVSDTDLERYVLNLPAALFSCGTLEVLRLTGDFLVKLPHVVCLPKLTVLKLDSVRYESDESFRKLISGCPRLQSLHIERYHEHDLVRVYAISSPTLKRLYINIFYPDAFSLEIIELKVRINTPALESLVLNDDFGVEYSILGPTLVNEAILDIKDGIVELVQTFEGLRFLNLSLRSMESVAFRSATTQFSTSFERLTELALEIDPGHWSCVLNLINCCVNLEVLDLMKESSYSKGWRVPVSIPRCFSSSLKRVLFYGFYALEDEMGMLRFILEHGLLIETVTLRSQSHPCLSSRITCDQKLQILNKVLQLPRASTTCKISFFWDGSGCPANE